MSVLSVAEIKAGVKPHGSSFLADNSMLFKNELV